MDQFVIRKSLDHKQGKVDTTRYVAFKNRIADVAAPYRQALALPLFSFLPRTTVHRLSLANTRRQASTWSSRSPMRASRASHPIVFTNALNFHE